MIGGRDRGVEPLDRWLDPAYAERMLGSRIGGAGQVTIADVHYKPYLKRGRDAKSWLGVVYRAGSRFTYCRFHRPGGAPNDARGAQRANEHDALLWSFPSDPAIAQLGAALSAARDIEVVNYRPGERCTLRARIDSIGPGLVFGKTYPDDRARPIAARHAALAASVPVPTVCAVDPTGSAFWMHACTGAPLDTRLEPTHLYRAAQTLARLHAHSINALDPLPEMTRSNLAFEARKKLAKLAAFYPSLGGHAAELVQRLQIFADRAPQFAPAPIHGDCHAGQWIAAPEGVTLLDLDELARGEIEQDLANFAVDLGFRGFDSARVRRIAGIFRAGYRRYAARAIDRRAFAWYCALALVNKTYRQLVQRRWCTPAPFAQGLACARAAITGVERA